jgi:lycopene cyclase domain-containing protein
MTYASLAVVFLAVAALTAVVAAAVARPPRSFWWTTATTVLVLLVLTAVFDSLMVATDLFRYDTGQLLGWRVFLVPVEDFAWPVVSALVLPALWELLGARGRRARRGELRENAGHER